MKIDGIRYKLIFDLFCIEKMKKNNAKLIGIIALLLLLDVILFTVYAFLCGYSYGF